MGLTFIIPDCKCPRFSNRGLLEISATLFFLFVVTEIIGAISSNSLSLIGDASSMIVDTLTYCVNLYAEWSKEQWGRVTNRSKFILEVCIPTVSVMSLLGVTGYITFDAVERLMHPPAKDDVNVNYLYGFAFANLVVDLICAGMFYLKEDVFMELDSLPTLSLDTNVCYESDEEIRHQDSDLDIYNVDYDAAAPSVVGSKFGTASNPMSGTTFVSRGSDMRDSTDSNNGRSNGASTASSNSNSNSNSNLHVSKRTDTATGDIGNVSLRIERGSSWSDDGLEDGVHNNADPGATGKTLVGVIYGSCFEGYTWCNCCYLWGSKYGHYAQDGAGATQPGSGHESSTVSAASSRHHHADDGRGVGGSSGGRKNLNMMSAFTHVVGDLLRTLAMLSAAFVSSLSGLDGDVCDAWAALVVAVTIVLLCASLVGEIGAAALEIWYEEYGEGPPLSGYGGDARLGTVRRTGRRAGGRAGRLLRSSAARYGTDPHAAAGKTAQATSGASSEHMYAAVSDEEM